MKASAIIHRKEGARSSKPGAADLPPDQRERLHAAATLLRSGSTGRALEAFDAALKLAPDDSACLHGRALALTRLGRRGAALTSFRRAAASDPSAWTSLASIADITPDEAERIKALDACADTLLDLCRSRDAPPHLLSAAAGALADAHRYADLARFAGRNAARFADKATPHDWMAKAHYERGRFAKAFQRKQAALMQTAKPADGQGRPRAFQPDAAARALKEIAEVLEGHGVAVFLAAGTLLGFYRSGGPLPHDRDIDIGIVRRPDGGPDIAAILRAHPRLMLRRSARPGDRYFGLIHQGVGIDLFLHHAEAGRLLCGVSHQPGDIQWRFSKFSVLPREFGGRFWNIPHPAERYLAESYGPDWRVPDKGFASAISSPALYRVAVHARALYAAARARNCLLAGDTNKALALARQSPVPVTLPAWIGR